MFFAVTLVQVTEFDSPDLYVKAHLGGSVEISAKKPCIWFKFAHVFMDEKHKDQQQNML